MSASLVGSEMCIRDRHGARPAGQPTGQQNDGLITHSRSSSPGELPWVSSQASIFVGVGLRGPGDADEQFE
eukprot:3906181-Alexandrium_andersonii.AAC.1